MVSGIHWGSWNISLTDKGRLLQYEQAKTCVWDTDFHFTLSWLENTHLFHLFMGWPIGSPNHMLQIRGIFPYLRTIPNE